MHGLMMFQGWQTFLIKIQQRYPLPPQKGPDTNIISEVVSSGMGWLPMKAHLQERFLECGSSTMAKHKLTQLKQLGLPLHEYIAKYGDMAEHAYSIKPMDSARQILASNFIEGINNPHVKNKLRSFHIKNLKEIFSHAIHKDQKQKIRAIDFGESPKSVTTLNCDVNAIKGNNCFKCGSHTHFIKDCPLNKDDNNTHQRKH